MDEYTIEQWALFLYIYSFLGWVWESSYVSIRQKKWINRGFLRGPMLPIYGWGAVMMLFVTIPFRGNYLLMFIAGMIGATALEYVTGWTMEKLFKVKYWDYSTHKIQLQGYICLSSTIAWGFFTLLMTECLHLPIEKMVLKYCNGIIGVILAIIIGSIFLVDTYYSAKAAFDITKTLEKMDKIKAELENAHVQLALLKAETQDYMLNEFGEVIEKVDLLKNKAITATEEQRENMIAWRENMRIKFKKIRELNLQVTELSVNKEKLILGVDTIGKKLLKNNPGAKARVHLENSMKELKERSIK